MRHCHGSCWGLDGSGEAMLRYALFFWIMYRTVICDTYNSAKTPTHPSPHPYILVGHSAYMAITVRLHI